MLHPMFACGYWVMQFAASLPVKPGSRAVAEASIRSQSYVIKGDGMQASQQQEMPGSLRFDDEDDDVGVVVHVFPV